MDQERLSKLAGIMPEDVEADEELITKIAEWIYHESSEPISEIEHLVKKADAVGEYMDAVSERKETGIKEDWKDDEFSAKGREADEKSMQAAQDRYDASQNKPEINAGDSMINSLDDIDKYVDMLEDDELDIREIQANLAHKIRNAVENIRNNLTDTNI